MQKSASKKWNWALCGAPPCEGIILLEKTQWRKVDENSSRTRTWRVYIANHCTWTPGNFTDGESFDFRRCGYGNTGKPAAGARRSPGRVSGKMLRSINRNRGAIRGDLSEISRFLSQVYEGYRCSAIRTRFAFLSPNEDKCVLPTFHLYDPSTSDFRSISFVSETYPWVSGTFRFINLQYNRTVRAHDSIVSTTYRSVVDIIAI